jgi:site-specific recombinase XerD
LDSDWKIFQVREEHGVVADLISKGKHIRTVPVPTWAKRVVDEWTDAASICTGAIFRGVGRLGKIWGTSLTPKAIWRVVKAAAKRADIKNLAPHDWELAAASEFRTAFFDCSKSGSRSIVLALDRFACLFPMSHTGGLPRRV